MKVANNYFAYLLESFREYCSNITFDMDKLVVTVKNEEFFKSALKLQLDDFCEGLGIEIEYVRI